MGVLSTGSSDESRGFGAGVLGGLLIDNLHVSDSN